MFGKLKQFLVTPFTEEALMSIKQDEHADTIAAVALMIEIITVDDEEHDTEKSMLGNILNTKFDMTETEAHQLIEEATQANHDATDFFRFTAVINAHYSEDDKIGLIENLWQLAWADKQIHELEEHVIRRLASLLHVSHKDFIAAKWRVVEQ